MQRYFDSIQDLLKDLGYEERQAEGVFAKGMVRIPFEDIAGRTVSSFLTRARRMGWVTDEEMGRKMGLAQKVLDPTGASGKMP